MVTLCSHDWLFQARSHMYIDSIENWLIQQMICLSIKVKISILTRNCFRITVCVSKSTGLPVSLVNLFARDMYVRAMMCHFSGYILELSTFTHTAVSKLCTMRHIIWHIADWELKVMVTCQRPFQPISVRGRTKSNLVGEFYCTFSMENN